MAATRRWIRTRNDCQAYHAKKENMPVISRFYGITIRMYFRDHDVPDCHATYGEYIGVYDIHTGDMIEGDMPKRAHRMCQERANQYRTDLQFMWISQQFVQLPGLD